MNLQHPSLPFAIGIVLILAAAAFSLLGRARRRWLTHVRRIPGVQRSIAAKAAYRSGQSLKDARQDRQWNFKSRSQEVMHSEILSPEFSP